MGKGLGHGGRRIRGKVWDHAKKIWVDRRDDTRIVDLNRSISDPVVRAAVASVAVVGKWICHRCTIQNEASLTRCNCCGARRPRLNNVKSNTSPASKATNHCTKKSYKGKQHFRSYGEHQS